jgi:hypothetical protein
MQGSFYSASSGIVLSATNSTSLFLIMLRQSKKTQSRFSWTIFMDGYFLVLLVPRITIMLMMVLGSKLIISIVQNMAMYLNTDLVPRVPCYREFLSSMVRRNVRCSSFLYQMPDLGIPPIILTLIWIDQTTQERIMLQGLRNLSPMNSLMACNHFHLAGVIRQFAGNDENLTIAEVSKSMSPLPFICRASRRTFTLNLEFGEGD